MIEYELKLTLRCDGCKSIIETKTVNAVQDIAPTRWEMMNPRKNKGRMEVKRRYRRSLIYCPKCADGNPQAANKQ